MGSKFQWEIWRSKLATIIYHTKSRGFRKYCGIKRGSNFLVGVCGVGDVMQFESPPPFYCGGPNVITDVCTPCCPALDSFPNFFSNRSSLLNTGGRR